MLEWQRRMGIGFACAGFPCSTAATSLYGISAFHPFICKLHKAISNWLLYTVKYNIDFMYICVSISLYEVSFELTLYRMYIYFFFII